MKDLEFIELDGKIEFFYEKPVGGGIFYKVNGTVPKKVVEQGEEAVLKYALHKIEDAEKVWKKFEAVKDDIRKNHVPIQTKYEDGTQLEGRIVEATSRYIGVELDKPLKGRSGINFGFASAMSGHYVFAENYTLSQYGLNGAHRALCWAYRDALHKPEIDLVERLNKKNNN